MKWCRVTRHPRIFCELTGCQRTPGKRGVTATSPTPFARSQPMEVRHNRGGKLHRPQAHYENRPRPNQSYDKSIDYKPKGRPYPIEKPYKFQGQALGQILNITSHDPQLWNSVIDVRKYPIVVYVWKKYPTKQTLKLCTNI